MSEGRATIVVLLMLLASSVLVYGTIKNIVDQIPEQTATVAKDGRPLSYADRYKTTDGAATKSTGASAIRQKGESDAQ